jgi:hypothetical protein
MSSITKLSGTALIQAQQQLETQEKYLGALETGVMRLQGDQLKKEVPTVAHKIEALREKITGYRNPLTMNPIQIAAEKAWREVEVTHINNKINVLNYYINNTWQVDNTGLRAEGEKNIAKLKNQKVEVLTRIASLMNHSEQYM